MALFNTVFTNKSSVYDMIFFSVKSVLEYPELEDLEKKNPNMFKRWLRLANTKYNAKYHGDTKAQTVYANHAPIYPEFSKILAITYGSVYSEEGTMKRSIKKISGEDEYVTVMSFIELLNNLSSEAVQSSPQYFPMLAGYNTMNFDVPLLIKRYLFHTKEKSAEERQLPLILKNCLDSKPWESTIVDGFNFWKFNGYNSNDYPLMLIADFLSLKKTVDLLPVAELSELYWEVYNDDPQKALEFVSLQSATQTNLIIQLMVSMRQY